MNGRACLVGRNVNDRRSSDSDAGNRQRQNRSRRDRARVEKFVAFERTIGVLEHNLDEWRRFHDWIVLTKGKLVLDLGEAGASTLRLPDAFDALLETVGNLEQWWADIAPWPRSDRHQFEVANRSQR